MARIKKTKIIVDHIQMTLEQFKFLTRIKAKASGKVWASNKENKNPGTAHRHIGVLERKGIIRCEWVNNRKECTITEEWLHKLDNYRVLSDQGLPSNWREHIQLSGGNLANLGGGDANLYKYKNSYPIQIVQLPSGHSFATEALGSSVISATTVSGSPILHFSAGFDKFKNTFIASGL